MSAASGSIGGLLGGPMIDGEGSGRHASEFLFGTSPAMLDLKRKVALVASTDVPVLLTGESGTGKACRVAPRTPSSK
jgi:hypothetical protein